MRYRLLAVGKLKRGFYRDGCEHYLKRLERFGRVEVVEVSEGRGTRPESVRQEEGKALLANAAGWLVALDERGASLRSRELAARLDELELAGHSALTLLIGGAEGLSRQVTSAAMESWSLSPLTLPHELARLVLCEQLYRAETIRADHPYHRE